MNESEFHPMAKKLLDKTTTGKLHWDATYDPTTFICSLEGKYSFRIEHLFTNLSFKMLDATDTEVFEVKLHEPSNDTSQEYDEMYATLQALYEKARRSSLDIDTKINEATKLLDGI